MERINVIKEERISQKSGQPYTVLILSYKGYNKMVFLNDAEKFVFSDYPSSTKVG